MADAIIKVGPRVVRVSRRGGAGPAGTLSPELQAVAAQIGRLVRPTRPAPPPAPAEVKSVTDLATPGIPTNGTDAAPAINAALAANGICILEAGTLYRTSSAILRPTGSKLLCRDGASARIEILPGFSGGLGNVHNAVVSNPAGATDLTVYNIIMDVAGIGAGSDPTRINGLKNSGAKRTRTQQCEVRRISGYGFFDQLAAVNGDSTDNLYDRCGASDVSYGFEQLGALRTYMVDCWADAGAATMNLAGMIHPVTGSGEMAVIRFVGRGAYTRGISIIANEDRVIDGMYFEGVDIDATGGAESVLVEGTAETRNVTFTDCKLKGKQGATLSRTIAKAFGTTFESDSSAGNAVALSLVTNTTLEADASTRVTGRSTFAGGSVFGISIDATSTLAFDGQVSGTPGAGGGYFPLSGPGVGNVTLGEAARLVPNGIINNGAGLLDVDPSMLRSTIRFTAAYDQTLRILADTSDTTLPVGTPIYLERLGAGVVTVTAGSGVTLTAPNGAALDTALATGRIVRSGANAWTLAKDVVAAPVEPEPPAALGNSVPMTGYGAALTLGAMDGDGFYPFNTTGSSSDYQAVGTTSTIAGDFVAELEITTLGSMAMGMDTEAMFASRSLGELTHSIQPAPSGGTNALQLWAGGTPLTVLTRNGRVYIRQSGTTLSYYTGPSWSAALAAGALWSDTAPTDTATTRFVGLVEIARDVVARVKVVAV